MAREVSSVHVDIARLGQEILKVSMDSADSKESLQHRLGEWLLKLHECLATRDPTLHAYGAFLLKEVDEFRKADSERKKAFRASKDSMESKDSADSMESKTHVPRSDQIRSDHKREEKENTAVPAGPAAPSHRVKPKRKPPEAGPPPEVLRVYEFWASRLKASARKADSLKWIERRGKEHGYERLIMAVVRYKNECNNLGTEEKFFKECANFFGEDAAFEGFLPDDEWFMRYLPKAKEVLGGQNAG